MYVRNLLLLGYPQECAAAATAIPDEIFAVFEQNFGMESGDELVGNGDLVVAVPAHHAALIFKRVIIGVGDFALLDNKLVLFALGSGVGVRGLSFYLVLENFRCFFYLEVFALFELGGRD